MSRLTIRRASARMAQRSRAPGVRPGMGSIQSTYALSGGEEAGGFGFGVGSIQSSYALSDDAPPMTEAEWRTALLAKQTEVTQWQEQWVKRDELQRWIQIAATLSIPIAAAAWRLIFGKRAVDG